ncbi:hypothetical protein [Hippea jasoniae]|uniref:hypothetical protein n=1 Tax=Hippea jasoniae TaxID=944479 RepID=UPI00054D9672|nr:hypothetical protein [Hippea jasoniae]
MKHYWLFSFLVLAIVLPYLIVPEMIRPVYVLAPATVSVPDVSIARFKRFDVCNINLEPIKIAKRTVFANSKVAREQRIEVSSIMIGRSEKFCVINGKLLKEGQKTGNLKVLLIKKNGVVVSVSGKKKWIKFEGYAFNAAAD